MTTMVRAALYNGETFVKFMSGAPAQINRNQVSGVNDWRVIEPTVLSPASLPSRTSLPRSAGYIAP